MPGSIRSKPRKKATKAPIRVRKGMPAANILRARAKSGVWKMLTVIVSAVRKIATPMMILATRLNWREADIIPRTLASSPLPRK